MAVSPNVTIIPASRKIAENRQYRQLRVAAYCRVSTEQEEQQNSYQVQISYYTDLINRNKDWSLAGIFADEGISGTQTKKRTEFNRMIRLCKQKKIDLILCKSTSRFARNTVDCLENVRLLKSLGIGVIFEKENVNTLTMTSEFMIALYGSFAQAESESISKNVSLGVQMSFREGKVRYQYKNWLGYKKGADGKPEIVPDEAETVRIIFEKFLDGYSAGDIAKLLNETGRPTVHNRLDWRSDGILRILRNEKYAGDLAYGSNINLEQMARRCPNSKVIGTAMISDYELEFRGVATIVPKKGAEVPVLMWEIDQQDEINLNRYEGFPRLYRKEIFEMEVNGKIREGMAYLMNYKGIAPPTAQYYNGIKKGYEDNGMDMKYLHDALARSVEYQQEELCESEEFMEDDLQMSLE